MAFNLDQRVFVKHPKKSWLPGYVTGKGNNGTYSVTDDDHDEIDKVKEDDITMCREDLLTEGVDPVVHDLLFLTILHDATLLRCLRVRYMKDIIYTNIGAIVVALNPFNFKIPWYQEDMMQKYMNEGDVIQHNLPHSWAVAHNTYFEMINDKVPQCILVSGESGAGKTEACKMVMKYLGKVSMQSASDEQRDNAEAVRIKVLQSSPILEGFGNAKTVRNDNSSRFGKFMKVKFHDAGYLTGAFTVNYLLEKSRIVTAAKNERVYHAFYYVSKGKDASKYGLKGPADYKSTNAGKCIAISGEDDGVLYQEVLDAMKIMNIDEPTQENLWKTVAGCLVMQNVDLTAKDADSTLIAEHARSYLQQACNLFGVPIEELEKELLTTTSTVRGETFVMNHKLAAAIDMRDALCKHLYEKLFIWLVQKINETTDDPGDSDMWIGVLDIFGFEDFEVNSFEQVCINLANESLQNHYNNYIFKRDMEECRAEGIFVEDIKCPDNTPTLKLITDNTGIIGMLDEECKLGTGTDEGFLDKVISHNRNHESFVVKPTMRGAFMVRHYAGDVTYTVKGFLDKNRDTLKDAMKLLMRSSSNPFTAELLPEPMEKSGRAPTVGGFFKLQVAELMQLINSTNPHWIRCIKPHPAKKPKMFDGVSVTNQLSSSGVLGTVKIRKAGYPVRLTYANFLTRYKILIGRCPKDAPVEEQHEAVRRAMRASKTTPREVQLGKTRVFMKSEAYYIIERTREEAGMKWRQMLQAAARATISDMERRKKVWNNEITYIQSEFRDYLRRSAEIRAERRRQREILLAKHKKERADFDREAMDDVRDLQIEEDREWLGLLRYNREYQQWLDDKLQFDTEEQANFINLETYNRNQIFGEFRGMLAENLWEKLQLNIWATPMMEEAYRTKIEQEEERYERALNRMFREQGAAMFRGELERQERRYRRSLHRLEDIQAQELEGRLNMLPEYVSSLNRLVRPFVADHQRIKAQATLTAKRAQRRAQARKNVDEIEYFTSRNSTDATALSRELATMQVGTKHSPNKAFVRVGDKAISMKQYSSKQAWMGTNGVPDIDQVLGGMDFDKKHAKRAKEAALSTTTTTTTPTSPLKKSASAPTVKISDLKTANVFEVFNDEHEELQFLRRRHLLSLQFRKLHKNGVYNGPFVHETEIPNKRTYYSAQDQLQSLSMSFSEDLVAKLRKLNSYCLSREIPDQDRVTGLWVPFKPVDKDLVATFPPCTDWQRLMEEEKRLTYTMDNYKLELLKIIRQCVSRGAKIPMEIDEEASVDTVHSSYFHLRGHLGQCKKCLFPMAPKKTLVQLRMIWPNVQDNQFPDTCQTCTAGAFGRAKSAVGLTTSRSVVHR